MQIFFGYGGLDFSLFDPDVVIDLFLGLDMIEVKVSVGVAKNYLPDFDPLFSELQEVFFLERIFLG